MHCRMATGISTRCCSRYTQHPHHNGRLHRATPGFTAHRYHKTCLLLVTDTWSSNRRRLEDCKSFTFIVCIIGRCHETYKCSRSRSHCMQHSHYNDQPHSAATITLPSHHHNPPAGSRLDRVQQPPVARENMHYAVRPGGRKQSTLGMPRENHRPLPVVSRIDHKQRIHDLFATTLLSYSTPFLRCPSAFLSLTASPSGSLSLCRT